MIPRIATNLLVNIFGSPQIADNADTYLVALLRVIYQNKGNNEAIKLAVEMADKNAKMLLKSREG